MTPDNVVPFPIAPMSAAERIELKDTLDRILTDSERQREAQWRLGPLKLWVIFAVKILELEQAKLGDANAGGWMLAELRKVNVNAREIANIFAIAVARLEAMEGNDGDDAA